MGSDFCQLGKIVMEMLGLTVVRWTITCGYVHWDYRHKAFIWLVGTFCTKFVSCRRRFLSAARIVSDDSELVIVLTFLNVKAAVGAGDSNPIILIF